MAEHVLRAMSIGVLGWMLWLSFDEGVAVSNVSAGSATIAGALRDWTTTTVAPPQIAMRLDSAPTPIERDWLAALRGAGSAVVWSGAVAASGMSVQPVLSPNGGFTVTVAAPDSAVVALSDELGAIDTVVAIGSGARFSVPASTGLLTARVGGTATRASTTDSVTIRRLLVIGAAGWESKFVVAALEEDGWKVDADIRVAPGISVSQGDIASIDTARYAAVVVLEASGAGRASQVGAYVRSGGGVILAGRASSADAFAELRAGSLGTARPSGDGTAIAVGATTLRTLAFAPVFNLRADAVALDRRGTTVTAAARRHVAGRVLQHGYSETWRWRMSGGKNSVSEHRRWWTLAVASVAYAPRIGLARVEGTDAAPLAALTAALGPRSAVLQSDSGEGARSISVWWLFAVLSVSLMGELASRRLRGVR